MLCIDKIKKKKVPKKHKIQEMYNPPYYPLLVIWVTIWKIIHCRSIAKSELKPNSC